MQLRASAISGEHGTHLTTIFVRCDTAPDSISIMRPVTNGWKTNYLFVGIPFLIQTMLFVKKAWAMAGLAC
jgi:hypothetical protein